MFDMNLRPFSGPFCQVSQSVNSEVDLEVRCATQWSYYTPTGTTPPTLSALILSPRLVKVRHNIVT